METKLNRDELIALAKRISHAEGESEEELDRDVDLFLANVPDPNASEYFFSREHEHLSPEEIVDKALSYRPIQL